MSALFRNPLLRLLGRLWWLPALTLVAAWGLGGERGLRMAGLGIAAYLAAIAGIVGAAWAHGAYAASRERTRHRSSDHRFLCPGCLHFGDFDFACGACGKRVEAFLVHTSGAYVNDCPHCHAHLLSRDGSDGRGVQAHCERCQGNCDRAVHHKRQVRVLATLLPADFTSLCQTIGAQEKQAQGGIGYACDDDGVRLTYLLNLNSLTDASRSLPDAHALWEVECIWLDASGDDRQKLALDLGKAADQFIRRADLTDQQRQALTVCVPQVTLDPVVQRVLETRFGAIKYGVAATDFLGRAAKTLPTSKTYPDSSSTTCDTSEPAVVSSAKMERAEDSNRRE
jgi:hypothetical protein